MFLLKSDAKLHCIDNMTKMDVLYKKIILFRHTLKEKTLLAEFHEHGIQ